MTTKQTIKRIYAYIKPHSKYIIIGFLLATTTVFFTLLGPVFIGQAIDNILGAGKVNFNAVAFYLCMLLASVLLAVVTQWLLYVCTRKVSALASRDMRLAAFKSANNSPIITLDGFGAGDTVSRMINDAEHVSEGIMQALTQLLPGIATIIGTLAVMLWQSPPIAALVVFITPASIVFATFLSKRTSHLFKKQAKTQGELSSFISETVNGSAVIHSFGNWQECFNRFEKINDELAKSAKKSVFYSSVSNPGTRFVNSIVYAAVALLGAFFAVNGRITIGQLNIFLSYANQYTKPFNEVSGVLTQMQTAISAAERLVKLIDLKPETQNENAKDVSQVSGEVLLDNVCFSYTKSKPLIENLNFCAKPGQRIAIVGPTGCGKTTLINLLMRFYELDKGEINIDGINSVDINRNALRSLYGMVLQDTWLKSASIKENIAYGKPNATDDEIIDAAKRAYAHSFIKRLPNGYDTLITASGNLSAGQRQLLCIARIMLTRPEMLILDEATSSIDTRTELLVQRAFGNLMQGRTSFVVAHRLSTIQNSDCILVMNDGKIVEQGTHTQLLSENKFYAKLYKSQFEGE